MMKQFQIFFGNRIDALWTFINSSNKIWRELFNKYIETFKLIFFISNIFKIVKKLLK